MVPTLRERIAERGYVLNGYVTMPGAFVAEAYAAQGWDCVTLDLQHGLIGEDMAIAQLQALTHSGVMPLCRVPWLDPAIIMKVLDAGSLGVTCPMISTAAQAEQLVRYCTYPPRGERSTGPLRASLIYGPQYRTRANDLVNIFPMIETAEAVENIAAICEVAGIGGVYIGAVDLAQSMGKVGGRDAGTHPDVAAAIEHVVATAKHHGLIVGQMAPNGEEAKRMIARGYEFVGISTDYVAMTAQAKAWISAVRGA